MTVVFAQMERISIHAPTRGATTIWVDMRARCSNFNPRSHKGSDLAPLRQNTSSQFQSTLPQGERPYAQQGRYLYMDFNPRSHKGSDFTACGILYMPTRISIHAPTRGATNQNLKNQWIWRFQSTLPQGERQQFYTKFHICFISFLPILSPYHISTHSPLPTFNHFLYIFSGANRPEISCLLPFRTKTISGIL